jgi:hypothetical protein
VLFGVQIHHVQALALPDAAPLFDVSHPRTMPRGAGHDKARIAGESLSALFPMMRTDMVAHEGKGAEALVHRRLQGVQTSDEVPLPLALITVPLDLASAGVKGRQEMARTGPLVLMLHAVGPLGGLGWQSRGAARPRRQGGRLVHRQHQRIRTQRPRARAVSSPRCGSGTSRDTGTRSQSPAPWLTFS